MLRLPKGGQSSSRCFQCRVVVARVALRSPPGSSTSTATATLTPRATADALDCLYSQVTLSTTGHGDITHFRIRAKAINIFVTPPGLRSDLLLVGTTLGPHGNILSGVQDPALASRKCATIPSSSATAPGQDRRWPRWSVTKLVPVKYGRRHRFGCPRTPRHGLPCAGDATKSDALMAGTSMPSIIVATSRRRQRWCSSR